MVKLMRCGKYIFIYRKLEDEHVGQMCPICEKFYDEGLHRPCIDICNSEKCLNCIILLKKCKTCPPEHESCQPSPFPYPLIVESTLSIMPKLEVSVASSSSSSSPSPLKKEKDMLIIRKIEKITVREFKKEKSPRKKSLRKKLDSRPLGKEFPKNVRWIPGGKDRRRYICTICGKRWTTKQNKKAHDHAKPKPFRCHLCTTTTGFTERSHYNYHMKSAHGIKPKPIYKIRSRKPVNKIIN